MQITAIKNKALITKSLQLLNLYLAPIHGWVNWP